MLGSVLLCMLGDVAVGVGVKIKVPALSVAFPLCGGLTIYLF